jgi:hypothetical protein
VSVEKCAHVQEEYFEDYNHFVPISSINLKNVFHDFSDFNIMKVYRTGTFRVTTMNIVEEKVISTR